ncbi:decaprenyl-phosphate phosphoribosyltransferase [Paenibacillus lautus]|uniref:decaprenyl-phosphate phosphoribosyltransferase n=1 Tax=Paenibacillus lautus TaxID=1401 RepID=UPI001B157D08|nr:decaprenyl-phosphate phosphoribosyltransferase [Paenibacillus lautus]GIP06882.1 decaprenyl-phosphate phosphoribosyltransferase [Paenibacillus lautus]
MNVISNAVIQDSPKKSRNLSIIKLLVREMRPKQWSKNLLVFAALIFSIDRFNLDMGLYAFIGFACFCIISSCVYILNDFVDREADKVHPTKKNRPIASGELNPYVALIFGLVIFLLVISFAVYFNNLFGIVLILYFLLNVAYSFKLKHIVILDVMTIASGFVLRAVGGALVIHVEMTPWFLICTMLLALFLGINKRRNELIVLEKNSSHHRRVLNSYSIQLIDQMNSVVTTATVVSYALFTFTSGRTVQLMWTIPLVLYGIFRYLYLIYVKNEGGSPEKLLFRDKHLLLTVIVYAIITIIVLLLFDK